MCAVPAHQQQPPAARGQLPQEKERGTMHVPASTPAPRRTAKDNSFGGGAFEMSPKEEDLLLQALLEYEAGTEGKTEKD